MTELKRDIKYFWSHKWFAVGIPLMMFLSYGTLLLNPTVGIDDTSFKIYYEDGVSPAMGRWCLYLIHKVLPLDYNPFFVEAVGLLFFCLSITLWCIVFYRVLGDRIPVLAYVIFGGVMLSSPMISEVVVWYLQDGIYLGYGFTALSVLFAMEAFRTDSGKSWKKRILNLFFGSAALTVATGFYESFMFVFLMAVIMVFLLIRVTGDGTYNKKPLTWLVQTGGICVFTMLMRSLIIWLVTAVYHLEEQSKVLATRNFSDILGGAFSWFDGSGGAEELLYVLKDFLVKYYLNAVVYLPVMLLVLAVFVLAAWALWHTVRKKDGWILAGAVGIILLPWVLPVLDGTATHYRSSQYVPLLTAFAVLLIAWQLRNIHGKVIRGIALFGAFVLLYNQGYEMNKWLYADAMKYEDTKRTMDSVALYLKESCDTSKPVCVIGSYRTPPELIKAAYCPAWSKKYDIVKWLVQGISPELFEKYSRPQGYIAAETPELSVINWGATAFYGFDRELIRFWEMHGFSFVEDGNLEHYRQAGEMMQDGPVWPEKGSVVETEEYIIVNFGSREQV